MVFGQDFSLQNLNQTSTSYVPLNLVSNLVSRLLYRAGFMLFEGLRCVSGCVFLVSLLAVSLPGCASGAPSASPSLWSWDSVAP